MSKQTREFYESHPERYRIERGGAVKDLTTNLWVDALEKENPHAITAANSQAMHQQRRVIGARSKLKGLIDAAREHDKGIELPDPDTLSDEEIISAGGDAVRLLTKHTALTYLKSGNLRGMGEVFSKLIEPFGEDPRAREAVPPTPGVVTANVSTLLLLARELEDEIAARVERAQAIDAEAWASQRVET